MLLCDIALVLDIIHRVLLCAPVTDVFAKCHLKLHIDITLHYILFVVLLQFWYHLGEEEKKAVQTSEE